MDEKLTRIFKIRPLQDKCIAYRSFTNEYRNMMKRTCVSELENLINVEMKIEKVILKIPDLKEIPNITDEIKKSRAYYLLKECKAVEECSKLL